MIWALSRQFHDGSKLSSLLRIINQIEDSGNLMPNIIANKILIMDAMHIATAAWTKVTTETFINCWKKAKFETTKRK